MTRLEAIKSVTSIHGLAYILGFKPKALAYILYIKSSSSKYREFSIPKKTGGTRDIRAPTAELLNLQRRLADLLQDCDADIRKSLGFTRAIAHGFVRDKSIMTNAHQHLGRRFVLNVDIEDFFGSINFGRVRGFFIKNRHFALNEKVATMLAQIVCHENSLPQGAPTSPVVSNLISHILDVRLARLASQVGCVYSRYADDLTFSTNKKAFPPELAVLDQIHPHGWIAGKKLVSLIEKEGFVLNTTKTRLHYADSQQTVTGLVVNKKVNVKSDYRRHIRQMVNRLCNTGKYHLVADRDVVAGQEQPEGTIDQLGGMMSFINSVRVYERARRKHEVVESKHKKEGFPGLYRKFLFFRDFYAQEKPVIVFEGKTDNIYLRCAMRQLADRFPQLAKKDGQGKIEILPRLYNYTNTTKDILGLSGGAANLKGLMVMYKDLAGTFGVSSSKCPVIILIDNDQGAKDIFALLAKELGHAVYGNESHYCLWGRLYIVPTPRHEGKDSCIEDLFDAATLAVTLNGKKFSKSNDFDGDGYYGKFAFATNVIKKNESKVDFSGFSALLETINGILQAA